jgi:hypothetical protein
MRYLIISLVIGAVAGCFRSAEYVPRDGDLIFQTTLSNQSEAIQLATHSPYSHMGVVYVENGQAMVFEAVGPVKTTPLTDWITKGDREHYVVKRLKKADDVLTPEVLAKMKQIGQTRFAGLPYDRYFEWSDERLYCSELVWKIYREGAGVEIGAPRRMGDYDLSHPVVKELLKERYGDSIPLEELVISPAAMFTSDRLKTVFEN